ncbi:MAG TPA: hypothetical protein VKV23_09530 [Acidimicrobiales bacterium]|nr:hypothetical protein [Acidimicrobiales bacterium]
MRAPPGGAERGRRNWTLNLDRRGRSATTPEARAQIAAWLAESLDASWFVGEPAVTVDDYEILVVGTLPDDEGTTGASGERERIERFREQTREQRLRLARAAQERFGRKLSWGARAGGLSVLFTSAGIPVMTRLGLPQRQVLDTLVEAGVASSRSEALAWCVELVRQNEAAWISRLRDALDAVQRTRLDGPASARGPA